MLSAQEQGQQIRSEQRISAELRAQLLAGPTAHLVEVATLAYWPQMAIPLLVERGPSVVPAIDAAATAALARTSRGFEATN